MAGIMFFTSPLWQLVLIGCFLASSAQVSSKACQNLLQISTNLHGKLGTAPIALKVGNAGTGLEMPVLGFGTCCRKSSKGAPLKESIAAYLKNGGRLIDTAIMYDNHKDVGEALQTAMQSGTITRDQLWVTSKIAPKQASTEAEAIEMLDKSLKDLQLQYVDLFLIHAPSDHSEAVWKSLIQAKADGKTKAIGVSNFNADQIQKLEGAGLERPSVNQIQFHPWVPADRFKDVEWCLSHGVAVTAYGSLGHGYHAGLENTKVKQVAQKYGKTPAQVLLSWAVHQGVAVVPGATSEAHIVEDLQSDGIPLSSEERGSHCFD